MEEVKRLKAEIEVHKTEKTEVSPVPVDQLAKKLESTGPIGTLQFAKMQPLSDKPNTLSGVVKDLTGNGIRDLVVIIKNDRHEAVRALKTNTLGQFVLVTPLAPGGYSIEIDPTHKSGLIFDIISAEVKGEVIPSLEFIGKN